MIKIDYSIEVEQAIKKVLPEVKEVVDVDKIES